ncbi:MAG: arsenate reductase ArsC [Bryobacteraceae bacterium]|nr:arsenate reductase ArsC [Bryobacteraceae bacterium]
MKPKRVLFVCLGNSCRSQMAEGFALAYGSDVMEPHSAGLVPAVNIAPLTYAVMREKNILLTDQYPKSISLIRSSVIDLVVNMSGYPLPEAGWKEVRTWSIRDPIGQSDKVYREVRDEIETKVMELVLELRDAARRTSIN